MRYRNLDGSIIDKSPAELFKWKLGFGPGRDETAIVAGNTPAPRIDNDGTLVRDASRPALTWIGHATFLVQLGGRSILIDPVFSKRIAVVPRLVAPGIAFEALPKIDAVLVTHNHRDHMDAPTLDRFARDVHFGPKVGQRQFRPKVGQRQFRPEVGQPQFIVPKGLGAWFRRAGRTHVTELEWWEHADLDGVRVTFVPSQHWSMRSPFDRNESLWGGYVLEDGTHRVYHSGDTAWFEGFSEIGQRAGAIDVAMLPIGAYEPRWFMKGQHMNPNDAARAFAALGAARCVAMHWGTFKLTDEPTGEPPLAARAEWHTAKLDEDRLSIPAVGETLFLDRS